MWAEVGRIKTVWDGFYVERIRSLDGDTNIAGWYNGVFWVTSLLYILPPVKSGTLEYFVWNTLSGILCMEYFVWNTLSGTLRLEYFV